MSNTHDREIYDFLAEKMLSGDRKERKNVLAFWTDLIVGEYEIDIASAGLDSDDKAYVQTATDKWFCNTLMDKLCDLEGSGKDNQTCTIEIKKVVTIRVRNIVKDLLFERKAEQKKEQKETPKKEQKKDPTGSISLHRGVFLRQNMRLSHLTAEVQDTVFMDPFSDAETKYLFREMLQEHEARAFLTPNTDNDDEEVGTFLARQAHLETLRARMAHTKKGEV